jgi:hypothetical protein
VPRLGRRRRSSNPKQAADGHEETLATQIQFPGSGRPRTGAGEAGWDQHLARSIELFASPTSMRLSATRQQSCAMRTCSSRSPLLAYPFV